MSHRIDGSQVLFRPKPNNLINIIMSKTTIVQSRSQHSKNLRILTFHEGRNTDKYCSEPNEKRNIFSVHRYKKDQSNQKYGKITLDIYDPPFFKIIQFSCHTFSKRRRRLCNRKEKLLLCILKTYTVPNTLMTFKVPVIILHKTYINYISCMPFKLYTINQPLMIIN